MGIIYKNGIKYGGGDSYIVEDKSLIPVIGTQTSSTGSWTGNIDIPHLYNGLTIAYFLPYAPSGNATLNLTLSDGSTTGPINCYYNTSRLTTHYGKGSNIIMTFWGAGSISVDGTATTDDRWIAHADYNTDATGYYLRRIYPNLKAGTNKIFPYTIIMQNADGRWESLVTSSTVNSTKTRNTHGFRLGQVLLMYANATYNADELVGTYNIWTMHSGLIDHRYSFNTENNATKGTTGYKPVYLVGIINNTDGLFYLDETWWTQTLPSTDNGKVYIYIGDAYDYYRMTFVDTQKFYKYINGALREISQDAITANGHIVNKDVPSDAVFTDEKVLQQNSSSGKYRPLLMGYDEINSPSDYSKTLVTNKTFKSQKLFFTPSNCTLTFYNETTTANDIPITFDFDIKDTTTGKTYSTNAYMKWYQDHGNTTSGLNMVIQPGGGMFLGGGEAPNKHYIEKITDRTDPDNPVRTNYTGEETFITSDSPIHIQANAETITNRKGLQITNSLQLVPEQADVATNNIGSIGTSSYKWANGYFTKINGVTPVLTDTKNTAGSTNISSKIFLIGATEQSANPQTYSHDTAYIGTDGHLYSNSIQAVNLSDSQTLTNKTLQDCFFFKTKTTSSDLDHPDILLTEEFVDTDKYSFRLNMTSGQINYQWTQYNGNTNTKKVRDTISIGLNGNITIANDTYTPDTSVQGRKLILGSGSVQTSNAAGTKTTTIVENGITTGVISATTTTSTNIYTNNLYSSGSAIVIKNTLSFASGTAIKMADKIAMQIYKENNVNCLAVGIDTMKVTLYGSSYYLSSGAAITSDKRLKTNIEIVDNRYLNLIKNLEPKRFKLKNNPEQKYHTGFIAQDVQELLKKYNINEEEFAAFARPKGDDFEYALSYTEFIPLLLLYIKDLEKQIKEIKEQQ